MKSGKIVTLVGALALAGFFFPSSAAADAVWKDGVTVGSWTNAENWVDGVLPGATTPATLTRSGADYRVTVESDTTLYATNTTVGNANGTTRFDVNGPLAFFPGAGDPAGNEVYRFQQTAGTRTTVGAGGTFAFDGPIGYHGFDADGLQIANSDFIVDGGVADIHSSRSLNLSGTARLIVTNGGSFAWHANSSAYGKSNLGPDASIHVHDSTFAMNQTRNYYWGVVCNDWRGDILVSGASQFKVGYKNAADDNAVQGQPLFLRGGTMRFTDTSVLSTTSASFELVPSAAGKTVEVTFEDATAFTAPYALYIGDSLAEKEADIYDAARSVFNWRSSGKLLFGTMVPVGYKAGTGVLNIGSGYARGTMHGMSVGSLGMVGERNDYKSGWVRPTDFTIHSPTGVLSVSGGALVLDCEAEGAGYGTGQYCGLMVGDGSTSRDATRRPAYGRFEFSGGIFSNANGRVLVGYGRAVGRFIQTGGYIRKGSITYGPIWGGNAPCAVGLAGGDGAWVISNGVAEIYADLFVGGATTNDMPLAKRKDAFDPFGRFTDAKGLLSVAGTGKFQLLNHETSLGEFKGLWLGRDGTGTLEVVGTKATCEMINLVMTNGYTNAEGETLAHGEANLRIAADANGPGKVKISSALRIAPNAKLEVDLTDYAGANRKEFKIIDCASRAGMFAPENVKLTRCRLVTKPGDPDLYVQAYWKQGLAVMVR